MSSVSETWPIQCFTLSGEREATMRIGHDFFLVILR